MNGRMELLDVIQVSNFSLFSAPETFWRIKAKWVSDDKQEIFYSYSARGSFVYLAEGIDDDFFQEEIVGLLIQVVQERIPIQWDQTSESLICENGWVFRFGD